MNNDHSEVLNLILKSEGGLNENEPAHVGGVSYAGITQKTYDGWLAEYRSGTATPAANANPPPSVRDLSDRHDVVSAFYTDYFERYHTWELPEFLQYIYADFVVNAGSAAVKIIQRMVEVDDDGAWGTGTSRAVHEWKTHVEDALASDPNVDNDLITQFHEQKLAHYNNLAEMNPAKFGQYLAGWKRRCNNVLSDLGHYFESDEPTPKALDEKDVEIASEPITVHATIEKVWDEIRFTNDPVDPNSLSLLDLLHLIYIKFSKEKT